MVQNSRRTVVSELTRTLTLILSSALLVGCWQNSDSPGSQRGTVVRSACRLGPNEDPYFAGLLRGKSGFNGSDHYGLLLFAMQEPSLSCAPTAQQSYRVLHARAFAPGVVAIRVEHDDGLSRVVSVEITRRTDGSWPITKRVQKELPEKDWDQFAMIVSQLDLWSQRSLPAPPSGATRTLDGSLWILEGQSGGQYNVTLRGEMESSYFEVARAFFSLAGAEPPSELRDRR